MKKRVYFIVLLLLSACIEEYNCVRPNNIPKNAYYLGGIDGGVWVDTIKDNLSINYIVYSEFEGKLLDTCTISAKNGTELNYLISRVTGYNGRKLVFRNQD